MESHSQHCSISSTTHVNSAWPSFTGEQNENHRKLRSKRHTMWQTSPVSMPDRDWKRRPGRPNNRWVDHRGHGSGVTQRPSPATRTSRWWWWCIYGCGNGRSVMPCGPMWLV